MLYKEFISALVMTGIITAFAIPMAQLSGESQVVPLLLLILAGLRYAAKIDVKMTMRGYPLRRVAVLFVLTVLYLLFLETLGFYIGALLYFIAASLIAQPMKITPKLAAKRVAVCFVCIAFLYCLFTVLLAVQIPKGIFGI